MKVNITINNDMRNFLVYRGLHVLCSIDKDNKLTPTHYAICLLGGPNPMWGLWTSAGKFLRFHSSRDEVAKNYSYLVWRRVMCQWNLRQLAKKDLSDRRYELELEFEHKRKPLLRIVK